MYTGLSYNRCWIKLPIHKKIIVVTSKKNKIYSHENNLNKHAKILTIYELK